MNIRLPVVSDRFYEGSPASCRHHASKLVESAQVPKDSPGKLYGGLAPHAGWMFSGRLAALTFKALHSSAALKTVVLFGADHQGMVRQGEVYPSGVWRTPLGEAPVDQTLAEALLADKALFRANPQVHEGEHSLEVQIPLIQVLSEGAKIVPVAVPPGDLAVPIGQAVGELLARKFPDAVVVGSTDLTHHGRAYGFCPGGRGQAGANWTKDNDARMIDLIQAMDAEKIVPEAEEHRNACGAGAVAAAVAACRAMGARRGICLAYTTSFDVMNELCPGRADDATVGYASVVFA